MTDLLARRPDAAFTGARAAGRSTAWWYLAPLALAVGVWVYLPLVGTVVIAFLDWNLTGPAEPAGFANFERLLREPEFAQATGQTLLYAAGLLPFATAVPMLLAILLWRRPGRASTVYRSLLFLPVMVAPVALAVAWRFLLNPLNGLANDALAAVGLPPQNWLGDPALALGTIVIITSARVVAFNLLLYSAALAGLDRRAVEAAQLEGATEWEVTRFVVLPQLARTTVMLGLLSVVLAGQWAFTNVSVLTQGEPDGTTDNVYHLIYTLGFTFFETGMASAAALLVLLAFAIAASAWFVVGRRRGVR